MRSLIILIILLLPACAMKPIEGRGPITLSPAVEAYFDMYLEETNPEAFAVSADGLEASYVYCPDRGPCRGRMAQSAIEGCEQRADACYLYARGRRVVWNGAAATLPD